MIFLAPAVGIRICFIVLVNYFIIESSLVRNQMLVTVLHWLHPISAKKAHLDGTTAYAVSLLLHILTLFAHAQAQICLLIFFFTTIFFGLFFTSSYKMSLM